MKYLLKINLNFSELFNKTSIPFSRIFTNTLDNTTPISLGEVQACFNALHDGAPGIVYIKKNDLTKIGLNNLTARFNVYLLTSTAPSIFKSGLTSLIPKCKLEILQNVGPLQCHH